MSERPSILALRKKARFWMWATLLFSALSIAQAILHWPWPVGPMTASLSIACLARECYLLGYLGRRRG